jgi:hypothetical protein
MEEQRHIYQVYITSVGADPHKISDRAVLGVGKYQSRMKNKQQIGRQNS